MDDSEAIRRQAVNLEVLRRYVKAWTAGDLQAVVASYHSEFTLHYFGRNPLAGDHVGLKAALEKLGELTRRTNRTLLGIVDVFAGPERGIVMARERFIRGDSSVELERLLVYTFKEERLHHCWVYDRDQELVDRFLA